MKKMLSVLLALVMILCACAPAFATEAAAAFPFAAESYNTMFETLVAVSTQATCETVKADDVTYVITTLDTDVVVTADADGKVLTMKLEKSYTLDKLDQFQDDAYNVGQALAAMALAAVCTDNMDILSDAGINQYTNDLVSLITNTVQLLDFTQAASTASDSVSYGGTTITCTYSFDTAANSFVMSFVAVPTAE